MSRSREASEAVPSPPRKRRSLADHPTVRFFIAVGVLLGLYWGYGFVTGPSRITERLEARLRQSPPTVDILVTSKFPPEEFHIRLYQQLGSMRGVKGATAALHSVRPLNVRFLSRHYWIDRIDLIPDNGKK